MENKKNLTQNSKQRQRTQNIDGMDFRQVLGGCSFQPSSGRSSSIRLLQYEVDSKTYHDPRGDCYGSPAVRIGNYITVSNG